MLSIGAIGRKAALVAASVILSTALTACGDDDPANNAPAPNLVGNDSPQIAGNPRRLLIAGDRYDFQPAVTDADDDPLTFKVSNKPTWARFDNQSGRLSGVPGAEDVGVTSGIVISVSDGEASDSVGPFHIEVTTETVEKKSHPGHYISMFRSDGHAEMAQTVQEIPVVGLQRRYYWKDLEVDFDVYDLSALQAELDLMAQHGRQLVVFLEDKSFNGEIPTPAYLRNEYTFPNRNGGYTALRWKPYVVERMTKLINAIGERFDAHPAFEGLALQESSLGLDSSVLNANGYTPELYRDALITLLTSAASSMPRSTVFWYMNFLIGNQSYIADVAYAVAPAGVAVGGPDILPDDDSLVHMTYPFYDQFRGAMVLFNSMQDDSYDHPHADTSYPTRYWTMNEMFAFARDQLHVNYLFWNRKPKPSAEGAYSLSDAIPTITANPTFNQ